MEGTSKKRGRNKQKEWKEQAERVEETIITSGWNKQKEWKEQAERVGLTSRESGKNNQKEWKEQYYFKKSDVFRS